MAKYCLEHTAKSKPISLKRYLYFLIFTIHFQTGFCDELYLAFVFCFASFYPYV